jgi:two-component system, OmpR family, sensor kinase
MRRADTATETPSSPTPGRPRSTGRRADYRGPDRRRSTAPDGPVVERSWLLAGLTLCVLVLGLALLSATDLGTRALPAVTGLRSASLVLAVVVATATHLVWRATGEARAVRVSTAAWLLVGTGTIDLSQGVAPLDGPSATLRLTLSIVAAIWIAWAYLGPDIDTSTRQPRDLAAAAAAALLPWATLTLVPSTLAQPDGDAAAGLHLVAGLVWLAAAGLGLFRAVGARSILLGWVAWLAVALAGAELSRFTAAVDAETWLVTAAGLRATGLLLAAIGAMLSLSRRVVARRQDLHHVTLRHAEEGRLRHDGERQRVHEVRNALMAIEGASLTLHRYGDELPEADRVRLSDAMTSGFAHLRSLLAPTPEHARPSHLGGVVARRVALARARGLTVSLSGERELDVACPAVVVTQVLDNLIENALRHGDARRNGLEIHLSADDDVAAVTVRDHGPGVPSHLHERIFERGVRLAPKVDGDGVGLPLARRLAREHGGDLRCQDAPAGGACFVLSLPRCDRGPRGADEAEDRVEVGQHPLGPAVGEPDGPPTPRRRAVVEGDDDGRADPGAIRGHDREVDVEAGGGLEDDRDLHLGGQQRGEAASEQRRGGRERDPQRRAGVGGGEGRGHTPA